jgi:ubiquinol-cytochrome c reductase iron-sulfur subunit
MARNRSTGSGRDTGRQWAQVELRRSLKAGRIEGELKVAESLADSASNPGHAGDDPSRRDFIHIVAAAAAVGGAAAVAWPLIDQMNPAADTLALASVEFDLSKVELGQEVTIAWRKQPLFIRHRTPKEIAEAVADDHANLKDPQTDAERVKAGHAEWLILLGSCTHLGCVPLFGQGEYGGWFCPCHGSVYDTSGRIRKGPAPLNLAVPEYSFLNDKTVKIG